MTIDQLKSNIKWWESKRWMFNLAVGLFGAIALYNGLSQMEYTWTITDTFGIIWWGIGANIFYSLGMLFEIFDWYYLNNKLGLTRFRTLFFIIGTSFSCFYTAFFTMIYFVGHLW